MKVTDVSAMYFDTDNPATGWPQQDDEEEGGGTTSPVAVITKRSNVPESISTGDWPLATAYPRPPPNNIALGNPKCCPTRHLDSICIKWCQFVYSL
jgi:hypothetical protein